MIEWTKVNHTYFEKFIHYIIGQEGFSNREWYGRGGGDGGRDVVGYTVENLPFNLAYKRKWIFQCKKWARFPSTGIILNEVSSAKIHDPDFWVLVIPLNPSAGQIDYLEKLNQSFSFKILMIPLANIEEMIQKYPESRNILLNGAL